MRALFPPGYGDPNPTAAAALTAAQAATGSGPAAAAGGGSDVSEYLQYVSLARELVLPTDPEERARVLRAKIKNYEGMKRKFPLAATLYDNEIRKMKAKLASTKSQIAKKKEGEQSTKTFRYLGWAAGGLFVVLLGTFIYKNIVTAKAVASGGK
jgi:hypothetical protein